MSSADTILSLVSTVGRAISADLRYRRMLGKITTIIILFVATTVLATTLLIGGIYAAYQTMLAHSVAPGVAAVITGACVALAMLVCAALIILTVRRLKNALFLSPLPSRVAKIANAFVDGLMDK